MPVSRTISLLRCFPSVVILLPVVFITFVATGSSGAQETAKPSKDQAVAAPVKASRFISSKWTMGCKPAGEDSALVCQASNKIVAQKGGQTLLAVFVAPWEQKFATSENVLRVQLPHGLDLTTGVQIQIDGGKPHKLVLQTSDATGLYARIGLTAKLLLSMKMGKIVQVSFTAMNGKKFQIPMALKGFSAVFDKLR